MHLFGKVLVAIGISLLILAAGGFADQALAGCGHCDEENCNAQLTTTCGLGSCPYSALACQDCVCKPNSFGTRCNCLSGS